MTEAMVVGGDFEPALRVMAEARRNGLAFDDAWLTAIAAVAPADRMTLRETAAAWQCEYERRNSYGGDLVAALAVIDHDAGQRSDARMVA
jgi:hypothetical protein